MNRTEFTNDLQAKFREIILDWHDKSSNRVYLEVEPENLGIVCHQLFKEEGARFNIASAVDTRKHIEILYHFTRHDLNLMISVRVRLDRENPRIASLARDIPATNWIEREIHELFGVEFVGHPDPRRLLLPEQWPDGVYPLRRDYREWDPAAVRTRGVR